MASMCRRGLSLHFTNVRGLFSNLASVEYHLSHSQPNLLLLSEPQISKNSNSNFFNISNYNLFHNFRSKGGVCAYVNTNTPVTRLVNFESSNFDVMWLKIFLPTTTIILCFCYCSPNRTDFSSFFEYLTTSHETLTSSHPNMNRPGPRPRKKIRENRGLPAGVEMANYKGTIQFQIFLKNFQQILLKLSAHIAFFLEKKGNS